MKKTYTIKGMDCVSCATMVELDLEDAGFACSCSYADSLLEVHLKDENQEIEVIKIVENSGYSLEPKA